MPRQVTEYVIPNQTSFSAQMYVGAEILSVNVKSTSPVVLVAYVLEDTDNSLETRTFQALQSGQTIPVEYVIGDYDYIGTFVINPTTQYHLFEKVRDSSVSTGKPNDVVFR
jgi:hypothetical protein